MNKDEVKYIAQQKLVDVNEVDGFLAFRGTYTVKNSPIAVYYIDYSDSEIDHELLQDYQEKLLSTDYYKNSGFLQWNYYLLFIKSTINDEVKKSIEQNDIYSRKFVLSLNEFETFFKYDSSQTEIKQDIVIQWKALLDQANLHEVYSRNTYVSAVDRFINGVPQVESTATPQITQTNYITNQHIQRLELAHSYRPYPSKRNFEFTNVNLINGINGSGKTSLLEAIELVLCGKSNRYSQISEPRDSIKIAFKGIGAPIDTFTPGDNSKFQERDKNWYNNLVTRGNHLDLGFNRHNFFNSESAYRINEAKPEEYKTQLESLALGSEFSYVTLRLDGFKTRLEDYESNYTKRLEQQHSTIAQAKAQRDLLDKSSDPGNLLSEVKELLKKYSWEPSLINALETNPAHLTSSLSQLHTSLTELLKIASTLKLNNSKEFKVKQEQLTKIGKELKDLVESKKSLNEKCREVEVKIDQMNDHIAALNQIKSYADNPESFELLDLSKSLNELKNDLDFLNTIKQQSFGIDWSKILDYKTTLSAINHEAKNRVDGLTKIKEERTKKHQALISNLNRLAEIETTIKSLGNEFLKANPSASECPLCGTAYQYAELSQRIAIVRDEISQGSELISISDELKVIQANLEIQNQLVKQIAVIDGVSSLLFGKTEYRNLSLEEIKSGLKEAADLADAAEEKLSGYNSLVERMKAKGLTETLLKEVLEKIKKFLPEFLLTQGSDKAISKLIHDYSKDLETAKSQLTNFFADVAGIKQKIESAIGSERNYFEVKEEITPNKNSESVDSGIIYLLDIKRHIGFDDNEDLKNLELRSKQIEELFNRYKASSESKDQHSLLNNLINQAQKEIDTEIKPILERVTNGLKAIQQILGANMKSKLLQDFFSQNDAQIQEIFQRIHAPRELKQVSFFTDETTDIKMLRNNGTYSGIKEISSGQRSALALSIFLTLNKKLKNGPNMLLFDDPVVYIDDLNVLSFLDYLRDIVINEERQIFFATANKRLAGFFEKKFGFLKDRGEFSNISLGR